MAREPPCSGPPCSGPPCSGPPCSGPPCSGPPCSGLCRAAAGGAAGYRAGGGSGVVADPVVLPGRVVALGVALGLVDGHQLAGDLLAVGGAAAGDLVGA